MRANDAAADATSTITIDDATQSGDAVFADVELPKFCCLPKKILESDAPLLLLF